jgi:hypothetical protein
MYLIHKCNVAYIVTNSFLPHKQVVFAPWMVQRRTISFLRENSDIWYRRKTLLPGDSACHPYLHPEDIKRARMAWMPHCFNLTELLCYYGPTQPPV